MVRIDLCIFKFIIESMSNWRNPIPEVGRVEGEDQLVAVEAHRLRHQLHVGETPVLAELVHLQPAVYCHSHFVVRIKSY